MDTLRQDIGLAWRTMGRHKAFSAAALVTLALGIGANTAIFSIVHGVLLRPLPYDEPDRLVRLSEEHPGANSPLAVPLLSNYTFYAWTEAPQTIEGIGAWAQRAFILEGEATRVQGAAVTATLFPMLRSRPALGRLLQDDDAVEGAEPVVVLSHAFWQQRFAGDPSALGQTLVLDGRSHTIVGVMPAGFYFPDRTRRLWTPYRIPHVEADTSRQGITVFTAVARLKPGATAEQAAAEGTARARAAGRNERLAAMLFGAGDPVVVRVRTMLDEMTADVRPALLVLLAGVGLVLLIACTNVANLFVSRGAARQREIAIRAAVGAGRTRLVGQLLTESLVFSIAGGALGVVMGWALTLTLPSVVPQGFPRLDDVSIDGRVLAFAFAVSVAAGLLAGLGPALRGARPDLVPALRESAGASGSPRARRLRAGLLAVEAALAVMLVVGASLLVRSFVRLVQVDAGYDAANVVTARLHLPGPAQSRERIAQTLDALLTRVRAMPAVTAAGAGNMAPLAGSTAIMAFKLHDPDGQEREARALAYVVTPGYAESLGLRLREGRLLAESDRGAGVQAMVVNEEFARTYFNDGAPVVGRQLPALPGQPDVVTEVVGVVGNVLKDGLDRRPQPEIYRVPRGEAAIQGEVNLVVRTDGDPAAFVPALRSAVAEIEGEAVLDPVGTLSSQVENSVGEPRFAALVLVAFAGLALLLAATGLYGVLSHSVEQRRREMGVRLAVGAPRSSIVGLVLRQGLAVTMLGLLIGLAGAVAATRLMAGVLFGIQPLDAVSFALAPVLLLAVAVAACLVPARRAATTDPVIALRAE
jgi:predicted permease